MLCLFVYELRGTFLSNLPVPKNYLVHCLFDYELTWRFIFHWCHVNLEGVAEARGRTTLPSLDVDVSLSFLCRHYYGLTLPGQNSRHKWPFSCVVHVPSVIHCQYFGWDSDKRYTLSTLTTWTPEEVPHVSLFQFKFVYKLFFRVLKCLYLMLWKSQQTLWNNSDLKIIWHVCTTIWYTICMKYCRWYRYNKQHINNSHVLMLAFKMWHLSLWIN